MKVIFITLLLALSLFSETAVLVHNKCSICRKEHKKSKVYIDGGGTCTAMYCGPSYYDENGKYISKAGCNTCTIQAHCSNGHTIILESKK